MTDKAYLWRVSKSGHRVHIENSETGQARCQAENASGGKPFDGRGAEVPAGRRLCRNCIDLVGQAKTDYREPDIRVLLGERLADVEPSLGDSAEAAKPWKWRKQAAPAAPKTHFTMKRVSRKPKRSNVKYARPFDDDLPW